MGISYLLPMAISNVSNFHYLALFICDLFGNGPFRTVHILLNPKVFDHNIFMEIDSICSDPIPFYLTDITQSFEISDQKYDNVDNLLQLLFVDPENLAHDIELLGDKLALYRIFIFSSIFMIKTMDQNLLFETQNRIFDIRTLILHYNESNVSVFIENCPSEQSNKNMKSRQAAIFILNQETIQNGVNLFDETFGEYERMESIDLYRINAYTSPDKLEPIFYLYDAFINYCHFNLKRSYINTIWKHLYNSYSFIHHRTVIENPRTYYKEASLNYKLIENGTR